MPTVGFIGFIGHCTVKGRGQGLISRDSLLNMCFP